MLPHFQRVFRNAKTMVTFFAVSLAITLQSPSQEPNPIPPIERSLPPLGSKLTDSDAERLRSQLTQLQARFTPLSKHSLAPDAQIYLDSVRLALDHNEFYRNDDVARATEQLRTASARLDAIQSSSPQWTHAKGLVVRGYASAIDGSVQPYGLVIPENLDLSRPVPLYVWLHGRGDQTTNLAFIDERQSHVGTIAPDHAIVLHPFGRHCLGFKFAGEIDVLDAIEHVASQYSIDRQRIVLMGFSMGGAGTWHIGAHYPDHWVAMSPGAGFAETARYQNLDPESVPPYQRILWGAYDVPDYVRNLFNLPVIAYSGEKDRQIQAARVMQEAFAIEQHRLDHRIGPGMGHKYHPDILAEILRDLKAYCDRGRESNPRQVVLQTRTLRYHQVHWVDVQQLDTHWQDTRVDAERLDDGKLKIITRNVSALRVTPSDLQSDVEISIDGQTVQTKTEKASPSDRRWVDLVKRNGRWQAGTPDRNSLFKRPRLQGPIDDAFMEPFLVVLPSQQSNHPAVQRWIDFELAHFLARWQAVFRGTPRIKRDDELTADDIQQFHLILWGDPLSNHVIGRIAARLPITWNFDVINVAGKAYPSSSHVPVLIYPNPESVNRYVVLNSGPTFREAHDRTNSLQNPKLPDWAVIDLSQPPDASSPGRIAAADFFDEHWKIDDRE